MPYASLIAVDTGSLFTKIKGISRQLCVPSVVVANGATPGVRLDKGRVSWQEDSKDMKFAVGWSVASYFGSSNAADTSAADWLGSGAWKALVYYALSELDAQDSIHLIVSTTYKRYADDRAKLIKIMNGKHTFVVDKKTFSVDVSTTVLPQAVSAHYRNRRKSKDRNRMIATIEVGYKTTDFIAFTDEMPYRDYSGTCGCGTFNVIELLKNNIRTQYGQQPDYLALHDILAKQVVNYHGDQIDVSNDIRVLVANVFDPILEVIAQQWRNNENYWQVFVCGGGSDAFLKSIQGVIPHAELMKEGMFSVVEGMFRYGQKRLF